MDSHGAHPNHEPRQPLLQFKIEVPARFRELPMDVRQRIGKQCKRRALRRWRPWAYYAAYILVASPLLWLGAKQFHGNDYVLTPLVGSYVMLLFTVPSWLRAPLVTRYIREAVGETCLACGYDLRKSKERCPECGTPFPAGRENSVSRPS
jgi:hypothetical protein